MDSWKRSFLEKLHDAQSQCVKQFEDGLDRVVTPAFDNLASFLQDNGFKVTTPLTEKGRRSFKFELAENAYLLVIFRFSGIGEFELRGEIFVPGAEPILEKSVGRVADIDEDWARSQFETRLDRLVDLLGGDVAGEKSKEFATV